MRVHLASDHAGFALKSHLLTHLAAQGHDVVDHGAFEYDAEDDYPAFCIAAGEAVVAEPGSLGIVIGGSGNGEQIAANKVQGVRAALVWNLSTAELAREHNDANVLAMGRRVLPLEKVLEFIDIWLETPFSEGDRHKRRVAKMG